MNDLPFLQQPEVRRGLEPLFEAMRDGMVVCDGTGRILASNPAAERILGLPREMLEGCPLASLPLNYLREDGTALPAEEHPALRALRGGAAGRPQVLGVCRGDEAPVWIELGCRVAADEAGRAQTVVVSFADVTLLRRLQGALRETEVRSRTLAEAINQSGSSVVITARDGRIEYVNPACCKAYGYTEAELVGANPRLFKSGETPPEVYEALWNTISAGHIWHGELSNRARDGRIIRETMSVSPVRGADGEVRHFVALKEDITQMREDERRRHELFEQVARLERMEVIATLAGGVAHDFNNVLVAILGYSELAETVLREEGGSARVAGYIDEIRIAGGRARELVQQLLSVSRGGGGAQRLAGLAESSREVVGLLHATLPDTIALVSEIEPGLPPVAVDPGHIHQILMNLLINARDAVGGAGNIELSVRRVARSGVRCDSCRREFAGEFLALAVRDDGAGVAPALRARIFEPFFTSKGQGRGTGMGLAVVHGIAHLYDGHVRMESVPGQGTEMEVLLPASLLGQACIVRR